MSNNDFESFIQNNENVIKFYIKNYDFVPFALPSRYYYSLP